MKYFENNTLLSDDEDFKTYRGVNTYSLSYSLGDLSIYEIQPNEQFRPDKICDKLYNDPSITWVLDDINNFKHGIKEYLPGKKIKYLSKAILTRNGIIN
jgi:hypothetical protein